VNSSRKQRFHVDFIGKCRNEVKSSSKGFEALILEKAVGFHAKGAKYAKAERYGKD
jgi:hypothetical protein